MEKQKQKHLSNFELMRLVRDARSTKHSDRNVLNALALRANPAKHYSCYPAIEQLMDDTCLDEKTVQKSLRKLETAELIKQIPRGWTSDLFYVNVKLLQKQAKANLDAEAAAKELPTCPFDAPTMPDEQPGTDAEDQNLDDELPPQRSSVASAILGLAFVGTKLSGKDADNLSAALVEVHSEDAILEAIASLTTKQLEKIAAAKSVAGFLRKCIENSMKKRSKLIKPEPEESFPDPNRYPLTTSIPDSEFLGHTNHVLKQNKRSYFDFTPDQTDKWVAEWRSRLIAISKGRIDVGPLQMYDDDSRAVILGPAVKEV